MTNKIAEKSENTKVELEAMFIKGRTRHYKREEIVGISKYYILYEILYQTVIDSVVG